MSNDGIVFAGTSKAADAPDIEAGFYDARFDGIDKKFIKGGQFGDGDRFEWAMTLLDDEGEVLYFEGEPVELTGLTSLSMNVVSSTVPKAVKYLKALMTPQEFAAFEAGEGIEPKALLGRVVQAEVAIKDNGWPTIVNILPKRQRRSTARKSSADAE
jgi:hypothetical protein